MTSPLHPSTREPMSPGVPAASRIKTPCFVRMLVWLIALSLFELARRG